MARRFTFLAGLTALALAAAAAAHGQQAAERTARAPLESPTDSLVLVLNIISTTHARPVTGVVLARQSGAGPALVLVPAGFVSAGDEIVVLDGGTDILRNGRHSRTVARSADAGVAVLEVEGLQRPGIALAADAWPPPAAATLEFAAWPGATELVEGTPLTRRSVRLKAGNGATDIEAQPALPGVAGPLLDGCGYLAAMHLPGAGHGLLDAPSLFRFLAASGMAVTQSTCAATLADAPAAEPSAPEEAGEPIVVDEPSKAGNTADVAPAGPPTPQAKSPTHFAWLAVVAALGLIALLVYLRRRNEAGDRRFFLDEIGRRDAAGSEELRFRPGRETVDFERDGHRIEFRLQNGQVVVTDCGGDEGQLALAIGHTPCLPGEVFNVNPGDQLRLGARSFVLAHRTLAGQGGETNHE